MSERSSRRLTRDDWVSEALSAMAEGGLAAVAVEPLAERLGTTKGSFYWHFQNRDALLTAALERWEHIYTTAIQAEVSAVADGPTAQLRLLFKLVTLVDEQDRVGLALLASADHPAVAPVLERVTKARLAYTARLFGRLGFTRTEARRRALLAYSAYLGHVQLSRSTPQLLPKRHPAQSAYLDHVLRALTSVPGEAQP
ncbi:MAG: TetR/AcrR family transcriptional regulator [Actinomycetes bacterium]